MSARKQLEERVSELETKVKQLQDELALTRENGTPWWQKLVGAFENDPLYEEAMRLGREYRESLRPKAKVKSRPRVNGKRKPDGDT